MATTRARFAILALFVLMAVVPFVSLAGTDDGGEESRVLAPDLGPTTVTGQSTALPRGWCPTDESFEAFLDARRRLPARLRADRARGNTTLPLVSSPNGVLLIEDDGVILRNDRIFDLTQSIEFSPLGDGYRITAIPPAYEPAGGVLFSGSNSWRADPVTLGQFAFPFGGAARSKFWVTPTNLITFELPSQPVKIGLCSEGCYYAQGHVLNDRLPRISPLQHGSFFYGWNAFVQEFADRVVVTWRHDDPAVLDVQAVLFSDGRIRFNYNALGGGIEWGAPVVVDGNDAFWNDLQLGGDATDAAGDVTVPAPDGPSMDFLGASARQVGTSELLQIEFTISGLQPVEPEQESIYWQIEVFDDAGDSESLGSILLNWRRGLFYWMTEPAVQDGTTLTLNLGLLDLGIQDNDVHLRFSSFRGNSPPFDVGDSMELTAVFDPPTAPMMLDLSSDPPVILGNQPIYESFTLPELQVGKVLEALSPLFENTETVEAFAIYQNLQTDLFFFGGGYHAGGNSGADGVGFGSSAAPRSPSLLHVNNIYSYGPEDWAMTVLNHELGHRWLYHFAIEEDGVPSRILNPAGSHPAGWVYTPAVQPVYHPQDYSVMGGSYWADNANGTFTSPPSSAGGPNGYTWHELYLIGLAGPEEVSDWWYIDNAVPGLPNAYWAPNDVTVSGDRIPVDIGQLIAVEGPRFPAYPDALQSFLTPVVMVSRPGSFTQTEIDTIDYVCTLWEQRFGTATATRGDLRCRFHQPTVSITTPPSDIAILAGDQIDFVGAFIDDDGDAVELRWDFSGAAPDTLGAGPHSVTFATTGIYPIRLVGVDASGMFAEQEQTAQVTVDCPVTPPAESVDGLRLDKEAGGIRFTWTDLPVPPGDYVILEGDAPQGLFFPRGEGPDGATGALLSSPTGNAFYQVAARNPSGCLGPY